MFPSTIAKRAPEGGRAAGPPHELRSQAVEARRRFAHDDRFVVQCFEGEREHDGALRRFVGHPDDDPIARRRGQRRRQRMRTNVENSAPRQPLGHAAQARELGVGADEETLRQPQQILGCAHVMERNLLVVGLRTIEHEPAVAERVEQDRDVLLGAGLTEDRASDGDHQGGAWVVDHDAGVEAFAAHAHLERGVQRVAGLVEIAQEHRRVAELTVPRLGARTEGAPETLARCAGALRHVATAGGGAAA